MTSTGAPVASGNTTVGKPAIAGMSEEGEHLVDATHRIPATVTGSSRADRVTSFALDAFPPPTGREEEWRFTPMARFAALLEEPSCSSPSTAEAPSSAWHIHAPAGVSHSHLGGQQARALRVAVPADRIAAVTATMESATEVLIPAGSNLSEPVRLRYQGSGGTATHHHVLVRAGAQARATVIIDHGGAGHHSHLVGVQAEPGAELTVIALQRWESEAVHAAQHDLVIGRDARIRHVTVSLGGSAVRMNVNARFSQEGGRAELFGLYYADANQHLEHRVFVDHNSPRCTSNVLYKGALQGQNARTVWVGDVLIRKQAEGTDSYEKNQNLILTDGARADSVPNLEIETGLIEGAGHASSTGRFDDEHLFYLMARGIERAAAQRLIVQGYLNEIIQKIGIADVEEELMAALDAELDASAAGGQDR